MAWRDPWDDERAAACYRALDALAIGLAGINRRSGRSIRVGFEPEPGCVVETTDDVVRLLSGIDTEWLGICLDLAHLACAWEEPAEALRALNESGIPVVKVQVSAALGADAPATDAEVLREYVEPRFLHQTRAADGTGVDDLDEALDAGLPGPWRVHYHVPLHAAPVAPLTATVPVLRTALDALVGGATAVSDHFDVETYTWGVLPPEHRPNDPDQLAGGIAAELAFARDELCGLGLTTTFSEVVS